MGLGKRLGDLVRANLNALLDSAVGDPRVEDLTDEELEAELLRRRERRRREEAERAVATAAAVAARARAAARAAQRPASPGGGQPRPGDGARSKAPPRSPGDARREPPRRPADLRLARLYATLETPVGSDFETVKRNFRRLMRQYHPDLNAGSPERLRIATDRSAAITAAYGELEQILARR